MGKTAMDYIKFFTPEQMASFLVTVIEDYEDRDMDEKERLECYQNELEFLKQEY